MAEKILHQFTEGMYVGDAVSDHAFQIRRWLRDSGFNSEIFSELVQPELSKEILDVRSYRPSPGERFIIYHHATGSNIAERLKDFHLPIILVYHNITPPNFYEKTDPILAEWLRTGRKQLIDLRDQTNLAVTVSTYNELELQELGFEQTTVLPIVLDETNYKHPLNEALAGELRSSGPVLLFVGRLVPNKRQEDLITLLYYLQRCQPDGRLVLVGSLDNEDYVSRLKAFSRSLGLREGAVTFTGHVSQQDMVTFFRCADLYLSMSEHEGFGKPLIESMYFELPVLAYGAAAVPSTMAGTGLLFYEKDFERIAEVADLLLRDQALRQRIITNQRERVISFLEPQVKTQFFEIISRLESIN